MKKLQGKKRGFGNLARAIALIGAFATAGTGCTTTLTQTYRQNNPTGQEENIISDTKYNVEKIRKFNILEPSERKSNDSTDIKVNIEESNIEKNYRIDSRILRKQFQEVTINRYIDQASLLTRIFWGVSGALVGYAIESPRVESPNDGTIGYALGGALVGGILGFFLPPELIFNTKTREERIPGNTNYKDSSFKDAPRLITEKQGYNGAAKNIEVILMAEGKSGNFRTNSKGEVNLSEFLESLDPYYLASYISEKKVMEKVSKLPIIREIKPTKDKFFLERLVNSFSVPFYEKGIEVNIATNVKPKVENESVNNNSKSYNISPVLEFNKDAVYDWARNIVDREINSKIRTLSFHIKDYLSRVPINSCSLEVRTLTEIPGKDELAGKFFSGSLKKFAENYINDYLEEDMKSEKVPASFVIPVYYPVEIFIELTHPDYKFVNRKIEITEESSRSSLEQTIYMVDKGSKIRIENEGDSVRVNKGE